jgi:hypothetical protein
MDFVSSSAGGASHWPMYCSPSTVPLFSHLHSPGGLFTHRAAKKVGCSRWQPVTASSQPLGDPNSQSLLATWPAWGWRQPS